MRREDSGDGGRGDELGDGAFGEGRQAGNGVAFAGGALLVGGRESVPGVDAVVQKSGWNSRVQENTY